MKVGRTTVWITVLVSGFCTGPVHYNSSNNICKISLKSFLWHSFKYFYISCCISWTSISWIGLQKPVFYFLFVAGEIQESVIVSTPQGASFLNKAKYWDVWLWNISFESLSRGFCTISLSLSFFFYQSK